MSSTPPNGVMLVIGFQPVKLTTSKLPANPTVPKRKQRPLADANRVGRHES